jgi:hypothetical protein
MRVQCLCFAVASWLACTALVAVAQDAQPPPPADMPESPSVPAPSTPSVPAPVTAPASRAAPPPPPAEARWQDDTQLTFVDSASPRAVAGPRTPGAEQHDGIMLRLTLGLGGAIARQNSDFAEVEYRGLSGAFSVDLGGTIADDLVLHARVASMSLIEPEYSIDGDDQGGADDLSANTFLLGPAATYYFMPANVYVTAAVGLSQVRWQFRESDSEWGDLGVAFNLDAGKEWWVHEQWGLGVAGRLWFTGIAADENDESLSLAGFALLFSATDQ